MVRVHVSDAMECMKKLGLVRRVGEERFQLRRERTKFDRNSVTHEEGERTYTVTYNHIPLAGSDLKHKLKQDEKEATIKELQQCIAVHTQNMLWRM